MRTLVTFTLGCLFAGAVLPAAAAEPLGRLFLTPEARRLLDAGRTPGEELQPQQGELPGGAGTSDQVVLSGIVRRRLGPDVVWINGERADQSGRIRLRQGPDRANRVVLEDATDGNTVRLKPGQFWEPETGLVADCRGCRQPASPVEAPQPPAEGTAGPP